MMITEAGKQTGLTRKAIEYYIEQNLISPHILENGYRDFDSSDLARLKKISVLRRLGLNVESIRLTLADESGAFLQKLSAQKQLQAQTASKKLLLLEKLGAGADYADIGRALESLDQNSTIGEKLLDAFPGYFGKYICLHFSSFLNEPAATSKQKDAYLRVLSFLDSLPPLSFPADVQKFLDEYTSQITITQINTLIKNYHSSIENPEKFLSEHKETLDYYYQFKHSDEYKNTVAYKLGVCLNEFNSSTGYYDIFIPAMKELSPSYAEFCQKIDLANQKFLKEYPESL